MKKFTLLLLLTINSCSTIDLPGNLMYFKNKSKDEMLSSYAKARELAHIGEYDEAIKLYETDIIIHDDNFNNRIDLAKLYRKNGKSIKSIEVLNKYQNMSVKYPGYALVNEELGLSYLSLGHLKEAETKFYNVLAIDAFNTNVLAGMGMIKSLEGHYDDAEKYYLMALEASDRSPRVLNNYAIAKILEKQYHEAEILLEEANLKIQTKQDSRLAKEIHTNLHMLQKYKHNASHKK